MNVLSAAGVHVVSYPGRKFGGRIVSLLEKLPSRQQRQQLAVTWLRSHYWYNLEGFVVIPGPPATTPPTMQLSCLLMEDRSIKTMA
jgi:hypothetical protein